MALELLKLAGGSRVIIDGGVPAEASSEFQNDN